MAVISTLLPAEAVFLLRPSRTTGFETMRVTLTWLLAGGYLRMEEQEEVRVFLNKKVVHLRLTDKAPPAKPAYLPALMDVVREAQEDGGTVKAVVRQAQNTFKQGCVLFNSQFVVPELTARGLLEERKFLIFRSYALTPAGNAEMEKIKNALGEARKIPTLLQSDPAKAAAMAAGLGSLVLLVPGLAPHYGPLNMAMQSYTSSFNDPTSPHTYGLDRPDNGSLPPGTYIGATDTKSLDLPNLDPGTFDLGSFDLGSLGSFDAGMASFDSGFSDGGGGGGISGGGGDSGGGGGGD